MALLAVRRYMAKWGGGMTSWSEKIYAGLTGLRPQISRYRPIPMQSADISWTENLYEGHYTEDD